MNDRHVRNGNINEAVKEGRDEHSLRPTRQNGDAAPGADVEKPPTLNELGFVDAPHVLQNAVVEGLGQLCRHGGVEVRPVAFQYALQRELAHTQDLQVQIHHAFAPRAAVLIFEQPQVQDFVYSATTQDIKKGEVWAH